MFRSGGSEVQGKLVQSLSRRAEMLGLERKDASAPEPAPPAGELETSLQQLREGPHASHA